MPSESVNFLYDSFSVLNEAIKNIRRYKFYFDTEGWGWALYQNVAKKLTFEMLKLV